MSVGKDPGLPAHQGKNPTQQRPCVRERMLQFLGVEPWTPILCDEVVLVACVVLVNLAVFLRELRHMLVHLVLGVLSGPPAQLHDPISGHACNSMGLCAVDSAFFPPFHANLVTRIQANLIRQGHGFNRRLLNSN